MNVLRYLSFEIGRHCPFAQAHKEKCPAGHPERYFYSRSTNPITDDIIVKFWEWARLQNFRGIVLWHMYNEPAMEMDRIEALMETIRSLDPGQPFQLTTAIPGHYPEFDIVKISDYEDGLGHMDNRLATNRGEGRPYSAMPEAGRCGRGMGWEVPIDYYGNWNLCCNDWRSEEAIGNILTDDWLTLLGRWNVKRKRIQWNDEHTYSFLPRMCRACLDVNPELSRRGGI